MHAVQRVLSTTELLENILVYLPATDINRARRVASSWNAIVLDSPTLQSLAIPAPDSRYEVTYATICPFEWAALMGKFSAYDLNCELMVHPALETTAKQALHAHDVSRKEDSKACSTATAYRGTFDLSRRYGVLFEDIRTFATMPPCRAMEIEMCRGDCGDEWVQATVYAKGGVRLCDLAAAAKDMSCNLAESGDLMIVICSIAVLARFS